MTDKPSFLSRWSATAKRAASGVDAPYLNHFRLREAPFVAGQRSAWFWDGGPYAEASEQVSRAFEAGACVVLVDGPVGCGKSFFAQMLTVDPPPAAADPARDTPSHSFRYFRGRIVGQQPAADKRPTGPSLPGVGLSHSGKSTTASGFSASGSSAGGGSSGQTGTGSGSMSANKPKKKPRYFRGRLVEDVDSTAEQGKAPSDPATAGGRSVDRPVSSERANAISGPASTDSAPPAGPSIVAIHGSTLGQDSLFPSILIACRLEADLPGDGMQPTAEQLQEALANDRATVRLLVIDEYERMNKGCHSDLLKLINMAEELGGKLRLLIMGDSHALDPLAARLLAPPPLISLRALHEDEVRAYLQLRLNAAGLPSGVPLPFSPAAIAMISSCSSGLPGKINQFAHASMSIAAAGKYPRVLAAHVALTASVGPDQVNVASPPDPALSPVGWRGALALAACLSK